MSNIAKQFMGDMVSFGDAYIAGLWEADDLERTLFEMIQEKAFLKMARPRPVNGDDRDVIATHYDLGNDLFRAMLGETMAYTCAYWKNTNILDVAQRDKMMRVCQKLELKPGMTVLDLGCGFGAFAKYCEGRGVIVDGITLSERQAEIASLYGRVSVCDYREATGQYDRVISLGLLEHVGHDHYDDYFRTVDRCLRPNGIHLFQTIAHNATHAMINPWIDKHIFPNAQLPSLSQLCQISERIFTVEDVENFGPDYAKTCRAWWQNCERERPTLNYSAEFWRMWKLYLLFSAATFRNRGFQLYQVVQTKRRLVQPKRV